MQKTLLLELTKKQTCYAWIIEEVTKKVYDELVSLPPELMKYRMITEEEGTEEHFQIGAVAIKH